MVGSLHFWLLVNRMGNPERINIFFPEQMTPAVRTGGDCFFEFIVVVVQSLMLGGNMMDLHPSKGRDIPQLLHATDTGVKCWY